MKTFYLRIEQFACDPENYPPPIHRKNGIDWRNVAWTHLGTAERMQELGALISVGHGNHAVQQREAAVVGEPAVSQPKFLHPSGETTAAGLGPTLLAAVSDCTSMAARTEPSC